MKKNQQVIRMLKLFFVIASLLSTIFFPKTGIAALGILSVQPNVVPNHIETLLTITGTDFSNGAVVSLEGGPILITTVVSSTTLTARLPAGLTAGTYSIVVTNPDSTQAILPNGLTIFVPSPTSTQTTTHTPTPLIEVFERPLVIVHSYRIKPEAASPGESLDLYVVIQNSGQRSARNILITFTPGNLLPLETGGILVVSDLSPGDKVEIKQPLTATWNIWGLPVATAEMTASYSSTTGESFTEKFILTIPVVQPKILPKTATPTPTSTPTATRQPVNRPQIIITSYTSSVEPLQPGVQFELQLQIQNLGNELAKNTILIVGGGSSGSTLGTPEPGGISGAGGEFTNFAPLGSSNIQALGDIPPGASLMVRQSLIVNVNTNPGAYPMRISFSYLNERGVALTDEQVITLLVYSLPNVDISFYRDPGPLFAGQPNLLPIQIVNLGRKSVILGNMRLSPPEGEVTNNTILVGTLDTGGYYTLDATWMPLQPGTFDLLVTVDYTDDFNQPRQITHTISVIVLEPAMPEPVPGGGEFIPEEPVQETFWQKLWRFILGLLGLDSAQSTQEGTNVTTEPAPVEVQPGISPPLKGP